MMLVINQCVTPYNEKLTKETNENALMLWKAVGHSCNPIKTNFNKR